MVSRPPGVTAGQLRFGIACALVYVAMSWAVRFDMRLGNQIASLVYPLDTFSMYGRLPGDDRSALLMREPDGTVRRVTDFGSIACPEPLLGEGARCADKRGIPYHYEELVQYIREHPGGGDLEVELITRTWDVGPGRPVVPLADCVVAHCKVAR